MNNSIDIQQHLQAFAEAFIIDSRRETWVELLRERPDTLFFKSTKLFNYLDHNYVEQDNALSNMAEEDVVGVFYDFKHDPKVISFKQACEEGKTHDAIFSIIAGKLVIYFFNEGWNFVCKK